MASSSDHAPLLPGSLRARLLAWLRGLMGYALMAVCLAAGASLLTWSASDPSYIRTASGPIRNALGAPGANVSDLAMRLFGLAAVFIPLPPTFWALELITRRQLDDARMKLTLAPVAVLLLACAVAALPIPAAWPLPYGLGGLLGEQSLRFLASLAMATAPAYATAAVGVLCLAGGSILLTGSLGMSLQDLKLICRGQGARSSSLATRAWRGLGRALERPEPPLLDRREPTFDMPAGAMTVGRRRPFPAEPAFGYEPPLDPPGERAAASTGKRFGLRRPARDAEFDQTTETRSRAMARRFAPSRDEPAGPLGLGFLWRRGGEHRAAGAQRPPAARAGSAASRPVWPGSMPAPTEEEAPPVEDEVPAVELGVRSHAVGDDLYRRAVALVRAQRKASTAYLQQSLGIGYMRAADLIDRMEREGIVGAPMQSGIRPILAPPPGVRIV